MHRGPSAHWERHTLSLGQKKTGIKHHNTEKSIWKKVDYDQHPGDTNFAGSWSEMC